MMSEYESMFGDNSHMVKALEWIYIDILTFHQRALRFFQGTSKPTVFIIHGADIDRPRTKTHFPRNVEKLRY